MECCGACFNSTGDSVKNPIDHEIIGLVGLNHYFCAAHRAIHCMCVPAPLDQPTCGDCSLVYYQDESEALWVPQLDRHAIMTNAYQLLIVASYDLQVMREEENPHIWTPIARSPPSHPQIAPVSSGDEEWDWHFLLHTAFPGELAPDIRDEIPRDDPTYMDLSTTLIPHPRYEDLYLLKYRTFIGSFAYMPCAIDMDDRNVFFRLGKEEAHTDIVFRRARTWSCKMQAIAYLPKDIRWVLMAIFDFTCDVLRDRNMSEDGMWQLRPWLRHWYEVADELFEGYGIHASSPPTDWFMRPIQPTDDEASNINADVALPDQNPANPSTLPADEVPNYDGEEAVTNLFGHVPPINSVNQVRDDNRAEELLIQIYSPSTAINTPESFELDIEEGTFGQQSLSSRTHHVAQLTNESNEEEFDRLSESYSLCGSEMSSEVSIHHSSVPSATGTILHHMETLLVDLDLEDEEEDAQPLSPVTIQDWVAEQLGIREINGSSSVNPGSAMLQELSASTDASTSGAAIEDASDVDQEY